MQADPHPDEISRIILLTSEVEAPVLTGILHGQNQALEIAVATTATALDKACAIAAPGTRLLSFCSSVIVPAKLLAALPGPSYNFHPGPPERPGRYPSVFALYDGAAIFGVTVHEMLATVDSGPIVAAEWFDIPPGSDVESLEKLTLMYLLTMFSRLSPLLARSPEPLRRLLIPWRGRKTTKADCDALCATSPTMDADELARRRRACGPQNLRRT